LRLQKIRKKKLLDMAIAMDQVVTATNRSTTKEPHSVESSTVWGSFSLHSPDEF
jgi:hypothetical protein